MISAKPVLIMQLRPEDATSNSEYACFLKYGQLQAKHTQRLRIEQSGIPAELCLDDYCAIIVGGSPFDISTSENRKSAIQKKIEADFRHLFAQVVSRDFPFLGACSGNGLLGSYLGACISSQYGEAIGCVKLGITEAGKQDPLLAGMPSQIDVLLGHKEACDSTPEGSTLLMTGNNCPVQMFRVGHNIYATQFHPEGDAEEFLLRIDTYSHHGYFKPHEADALKKGVCKKSTPYAQEILRRFVARYYHAPDKL